MKPNLIYNQMCNISAVNMYTKQFTALAKNVFRFKKMPESVNMKYVNSKLVRQGSVAFFIDEILDEILALPYTILGKRDLYGEPIDIEVYGLNGYRKRLKKGEYVIMYDNNSFQPIFIDIIQYAQRVANCTRVGDINISQQKTPRFFQVNQDKVETFKHLMNEIDSNEEVISTFDNIALDEITSILAPAPYVADKIAESKEKIYNEFLRFIGIASLNVQKKERLIRDEVSTAMGGTIAFRFNRFEPRKEAIEKINKKFGTNISVEYYDGEPNSDEKEGDFDDMSNISDNSTD